MSTNTIDKPRKVTTATLRKMKAEGEKIAMLTAYDYSMARLVDASGMDVILVGDSATNVMAGNETTLPMTLDEMIYHARCVSRGTDRALVVADMPFGTYQGDANAALHNAVRLMKESGCQAVKIERGREIRESMEKILSAGIPIMAHLGLTPQSVNKFGGYGIRAKEEAEAQRLLEDALLLEGLGIGARSGVDGQVLVVNDMLGMNKGFKPKFLRLYADLQSVIDSSLKNYIADVKAVSFPSAEEQY